MAEHVVLVQQGSAVRAIVYSDTESKEEARRYAANFHTSALIVGVLTMAEYEQRVDNMYIHLEAEKAAEEHLAQLELHAEHVQAIENGL